MRSLRFLRTQLPFAMLLILIVALDPATLATPPAKSPATASQPREFQPGIRIDWKNRQLELDGAIVLRQGQLELFACAGGAKAHESIVGLASRPLHVYQALGLIGLEPGHPGWWDEKNNREVPATGDPVDVLVRWRDHGHEHTASACDWMKNLRTEKPLAPTHWIFCGSQRLAEGQFAADIYGTVITVVDFDVAVLTMAPPGTPLSTSRPASPPLQVSAGSQPSQVEGQHEDRATDIPLAAITSRIPPLGSPVTVILRPARTAASRPLRN